MEKENKNLKTISSIGIFYAIIVLIGDGFQSIVSKSRPEEINSLFFAWITACGELIIITIPLIISILKKKRSNSTNIGVFKTAELNSISKFNLIIRLSLAGIIFAGCAYYLIYGFTLVDNVTGILAVKTQPISMIFIGAIFLKEKLTPKEILIASIMIIIIIFLTTEGTFNLGNFSIGVIYLLLVPIFWNIGHSIAKPLLNMKILNVPEFVFIRIAFTTGILGIIFLFFGDKSSLAVILEAKSIISIIAMSLLFSYLHLLWYQAVRALPLSIASIIVIPSPIITALFAFFILKEPLYYYHYVGLFGEIIGLTILILIQKNKRK